MSHDPSLRVPADLLDRYLTGQCTPAERDQIATMLAANPRVAAFVTEMRSVLPDDGMTDQTIDGAWDRFVQEREQRSNLTHRLAPQQSERRWVKGALLGVASCAVFALVAMFGMGNWPSRGHAPASHTYTTTIGQHATVTLANGTRATLGPVTTLTVTSNATHGGTDVSLTGEAMFTVTPDDRATFTVHAGRSVTRVLGTTFVVRRYENERVTRVVVMDGRVALRGAASSNASPNPVVLAHHTLGVVDDSGTVRVTPNISVDDYTGWMRGQLVFRQTPVRDVVAELSRVYDVEIRLADSALAARTLTCTVPIANRSLSDVLDLLGVTLDAHVTRAGRIVSLAPGRATSTPRPIFQSPFTAPMEAQHGR